MWQTKIAELNAILVGALRREKVAEHALERSQAEIEQLNHLVYPFGHMYLCGSTYF